MSARRKAWLANFALVLASLAIGLVVAELAVRAVLDTDYEVHPRGLYVADETVGYAPAPDFRGTFEREEFRHDVSINSRGFRGSELEPRSAATFRIVCIGDSYTWGLGVADKETFPARLERLLAARLPGVDLQVVNAGVPGYGTVDEQRFLSERVEMLDPDLVILQFLAENDFRDNREPALNRVELRDGYLVSAEAPRPQPWRTIEWLKRHSRLANLTSERAGFLAIKLGVLTPHGGNAFDAADARIASDALAGIVAEVRAHGGETVVMFATSQAPVIAPTPLTDPAVEVVKNAAKNSHAGFFDLTPALRAHPERDQLYYPLDGHWTPAGHAAAAAILADYLMEHYEASIRARAS